MFTPTFNVTANEHVLPSMALDFTTASLDARVAITRALDTATRTNSSGYVEVVNANQPRFDYDPITKVCRGLLIEETRANLFIQSENFPAWSAATTTATLAAGTSPAGTNTANKLAPTNGSNATLSYVLKGVSKAASAITYTFTVYAKAAEYSQVFVMMHGASTANRVVALATLTDGSLSSTGAFGTFTNYVGSTENVGDGWYRIRLTGTTNTDATVSARVYPYLSGGTGDGTSGVLVWGAQFETGGFATSYIPTTTTSLTRDADVAVMTGTNFSNWWQSTQGSFAARAIPSIVTGTRPLVQVDDGTANEIIALRANITDPELYIVDGGSLQAQIDAGTVAANTAYTLSAAWTENNCAAAVNGGAAVTDTTATLPTVTQARLGSDGTNYLNGRLQTVRFWPQRLVNAEVQAFSKL